MNRFRKLIELLVLPGLFVFAAAFAAPGGDELPQYVATERIAGRLASAGGDTMQDLMDAWAREFRSFQPDAQFDFHRNTRLSAEGYAELLEGKVDLVLFVREPFTSELAAFESRFGYPMTLVNVAGGSYATKGGTHAIAIYVNAKNPVNHLSMPELDAIFSKSLRRGAAATITRWGQLGLGGEWRDRPLHVYGMLRQRETGNPPGIVNFLKQRVLLDGEWRNDLLEQVDTAHESALAAITNRVAADPAGIGYSGFAYAVPGTRIVALAESNAGPFHAGLPQEVADRSYPLSRQIYLGLKVPPDQPMSPLVREFLRFVLSRQGQALVAADRMQFLPLTPAQAATARAQLISGPGDATVAETNPDLPPYIAHRVTIPADVRYFGADGSINIVGYNDMKGILSALDARFSEAHPNVRFSLDLRGTRTAPPALANGSSVFAPMGAEFSDDELALYRQSNATDPVPFRIAHAALDTRALSAPLAIFVHASNPLEQITLDQAKRIFTAGTAGAFFEPILQWKQLGLTGAWADRPVRPYGLEAHTALGLFMQRHKLDGNRYRDDFTGLSQSSAVVEAIGGNPDAIGFAALNRASVGVKILAVAEHAGEPPSRGARPDILAGHYPLDRHLLIYVRQPVDPLVREYLRFVLSYEGQHLIAASPPGYLPLNRDEVAAELAKLDRIRPAEPNR